MHLGVDHARQDMQAAAIDRLAGRGPRQVADGGDAPARDAEIAHALAVVIDDGAALEDQIVGLGHSNVTCCWLVSACTERLTFAATSGKYRSPMKAALLPDRGVVKVAGDDARELPQRARHRRHRQGRRPARPRFAALLTPQGKIIADFIVAEAAADDGGGFFLDCPRALAPALVERLNFYGCAPR